MRITEMHITPIALGDPPLLNAAGLHAPYALRTVVELVTDNGLTGLAEVPGSAAVDNLLEQSREIVLGSDPFNWHALKAKLGQHFKPEDSLARGQAPWDQRKVVQIFSAMDVACLDIAGKAFGVPVATLLPLLQIRGCRRRACL
jgi:glucarate dehydratase